MQVSYFSAVLENNGLPWYTGRIKHFLRSIRNGRHFTLVATHPVVSTYDHTMTCTKHTVLSGRSQNITISVLKSGLVRSFTPILRQLDQNRSFHFPYLRQPDQDRSRPVHVGPHSGCKPVATGLYQDRSKTSSQPIQNNI